jgi:hypothetical protein
MAEFGSYHNRTFRITCKRGLKGIIDNVLEEKRYGSSVVQIIMDCTGWKSSEDMTWQSMVYIAGEMGKLDDLRNLRILEQI